MRKLSVLELIILVLMGGVLGAIITAPIMRSGNAELTKRLDDVISIGEVCLSQYTELLETTQTLIEAANVCVDTLWEAPLEVIEGIRQQDKPSPLPDVMKKPVIMQPTFDPTFL